MGLHRSDSARRLVLLAALVGLLLAPACAGGTARPVPPSPAATFTSTPVPTLTASRTPTIKSTRTPTRTARPTLTPTPEVLPEAMPEATLTATPFPRALDAYGITYDPEAAAEIPLRRSASMPIWENALPVKPVEGGPLLVAHAIPDGLGPVDPEALTAAGCVPGIYGTIECAADSPLRAFPCDNVIQPLAVPEELLLAPQPGGAVVAECLTQTDDWEQAEGSGLYITGCAFRAWVGVIFDTRDGYVLVDTPEALRQQYAPIQSPAEAVSYAQLRTGLEADFFPRYDSSLLYLQEIINGTHVVEEGDGYRINLYHRPGCSCEPYVYSQVTVQVARDGTVEWISAEPYALTTGFGCAD